jgi:hypothetical protein
VAAAGGRARKSARKDTEGEHRRDQGLRGCLGLFEPWTWSPLPEAPRTCESASCCRRGASLPSLSPRFLLHAGCLLVQSMPHRSLPAAIPVQARQVVHTAAARSPASLYPAGIPLRCSNLPPSILFSFPSDDAGSSAIRRSSPPPRQLRVKLVGAGNCTRQIPDAASGAEEGEPGASPKDRTPKSKFWKQDTPDPGRRLQSRGRRARCGLLK